MKILAMIRFQRAVLTGVAFFFFTSGLQAQSARINDPNQIGWYAVNALVKLGGKWSASGEFQWRRDDWIKSGQQNLYRGSLNYQVHPAVSLRVGYAYAATFPYGEPTIQPAGKTFPEHRTFQAAWITQDIGRLQMTHRFMLEQRWIGRFTASDLEKADDYLFYNRMRYMARLQAPLQKPSPQGGFWYAAAFDEILIGFGKYVQQNVFDQNRLSALIGRQFSPRFRAEGGFLSQIVQLGRRVENTNVFQYNTGFLLSTTFTLDASKKARP